MRGFADLPISKGPFLGRSIHPFFRTPFLRCIYRHLSRNFRPSPGAGLCAGAPAGSATSRRGTDSCVGQRMQNDCLFPALSASLLMLWHPGVPLRSVRQNLAGSLRSLDVVRTVEPVSLPPHALSDSAPDTSLRRNPRPTSLPRSGNLRVSPPARRLLVFPGPRRSLRRIKLNSRASDR